jgi:hypothetical protein
MFGEIVTGKKKEKDIEEARIAFRCSQHDQFLLTQHSREELLKFEEGQKRMVTTLANKFDFRISFDGSTTRKKSKSPSPERSSASREKTMMIPRKTLSTNLIDLLPTSKQQSTPIGGLLKRGTILAANEETLLDLLSKDNTYTKEQLAQFQLQLSKNNSNNQDAMSPFSTKTKQSFNFTPKFEPHQTQSIAVKEKRNSDLKPKDPLPQADYSIVKLKPTDGK